MNRSETSSATPAGTNVITAATGDRSTISSSTMISSAEKMPICFNDLLALLLFAALSATCPARWSWSPGVAPAFGNVASKDATTGLSPATSLASRVTVTCSCTASCDGETAASLTSVTPATFLASSPSRAIAASSALVSGVPERAATMVILLVVRSPSSGAPSVCACTLGAPLARNRLGSLLTSLPSEGSATVAPTSATTQAAMTSHRNLTTPAARAAKNLTTPPDRRDRPRRAGCDGCAVGRRCTRRR